MNAWASPEGYAEKIQFEHDIKAALRQARLEGFRAGIDRSARIVEVAGAAADKLSKDELEALRTRQRGITVRNAMGEVLTAIRETRGDTYWLEEEGQ